MMFNLMSNDVSKQLMMFPNCRSFGTEDSGKGEILIKSISIGKFF